MAIDTMYPASMDGATGTGAEEETGIALGWFQQQWRRLFGSRVALRQDEGRVSWLSYLLMVTQSATLVLIFGHGELPLLTNPNFAVRGVAVISLFVLIAGTWAADSCAQKSFARVGILWRFRQTFAAVEHATYVAFIIILEMMTYAVALNTIEGDPTRLVSTQPILPTSGPIQWGLVGLRAAMLAFTYVQLRVVAEELPLEWVTLMNAAKKEIGAHAATLLANLKLRSTDLAGAMASFAEVSKPPKRKPWPWNKWLRQMDELHEAELDAQRGRVVETIHQMTHDAADDVQAAWEAAEARIAEAEARVQAAWNAISDETEQRMLHVLLALALGDVPPELGDLMARYPQLAALVQAGAFKPQGPGRGPRGGRRETANSAPKSTAERWTALLDDVGVTPAPKPDGRKGVWVASSDLGRLITGEMSADIARELVKTLGGGAKHGTRYIAPIAPLFAALDERHILAPSAMDAWRKYFPNADVIGDESGPERGNDSGSDSGVFVAA